MKEGAPIPDNEEKGLLKQFAGKAQKTGKVLTMVSALAAAPAFTSEAHAAGEHKLLFTESNLHMEEIVKERGVAAEYKVQGYHIEVEKGGALKETPLPGYVIRVKLLGKDAPQALKDSHISIQPDGIHTSETTDPTKAIRWDGDEKDPGSFTQDAYVFADHTPVGEKITIQAFDKDESVSTMVFIQGVLVYNSYIASKTTK